MADLDSVLSRELDGLERFYTALHDLGFQYNLAVVARYSCETAPLSKELVFLALRETIQQHAALSLVVSPRGVNGDGGPCFRRLREIDLNGVVEFVNKPPVSGEEERKYLDGVLSYQNNRGFNMGGWLPLWRIVVLQGEQSLATDLVFVWHHVIADERSGLVFHSTMLRALRSASHKTGEEDEEPAIVRTPILPKTISLMDYLFPESDSSKLLNKFKFSMSTDRGRWIGYCYHVREPPNKTPTLQTSISAVSMNSLESRCQSGEEPVETLVQRPPAALNRLESLLQSEQTSTKTLIRRISVPAASVSSLEKRCQSKQISITAFLRVLAGKVLAETFKGHSQLRCETMVSLRASFSNSGIKNGMGLCTTASRQDYTYSALLGAEGRFPWGVAKKSVPKIEKDNITEFRDATLDLLGNIPDIEAYSSEKLGKKRKDSYSIVNIGVFDSEAAVSRPSATAGGGNYQWSISKMIFSQSCNVIGSAVRFCIASTKGGEMDIVLSWQEGVIPEDNIDQVVQALREQLLVLADGG